MASTVTDCPAFGFIEPERYDRVIRLLKERNAKYKRSDSVRNDPRAGIPKRSTRFPGQLCRCGVCGRLFVFGGHGKKDRLMCNGARDYECFNALTVSGPDVALAVSEQIREFVQNMEGFNEAATSEYERQRKTFSCKVNSDIKELKNRLTSSEGQAGQSARSYRDDGCKPGNRQTGARTRKADTGDSRSDHRLKKKNLH